MLRDAWYAGGKRPWTDDRAAGRTDPRAERCQKEFEQVRMAFNLRIMPHVDPDILVKVRAIQWLLPINGR